MIAPIREPAPAIPVLGLLKFLHAVDDGNVGVMQRRQNLGLALESSEAVGIAGEPGRQYFDRDITLKLRVARPVHLAHSARANGRQYLVDSQSGSGRQWHAAAHYSARLLPDGFGLGEACRPSFLLGGLRFGRVLQAFSPWPLVLGHQPAYSLNANATRLLPEMIATYCFPST